MKKIIFLLCLTFTVSLAIAQTPPQVYQDTITAPAILLDSATQHMLDSMAHAAAHNFLDKPVTVLSWHTTWFTLILAIWGALELITRAIPGATPFTKKIGQYIKQFSDWFNRK